MEREGGRSGRWEQDGGKETGREGEGERGMGREREGGWRKGGGGGGSSKKGPTPRGDGVIGEFVLFCGLCGWVGGMVGGSGERVE